MAANVETMFYVREKPWHGLGVEVQDALNSADALKMAGLDWEVKERNIQGCGTAQRSRITKRMSAARMVVCLVLSLTAIRSCRIKTLSALPMS